MKEKLRNDFLEEEVKKIMSKTNNGHYQWTSRHDSCYYDKNTLVVVFTQEFNDGIHEKKYSLLVLITPAGRKTIYNENFCYEQQGYEDYNLFINKILNITKEGNQYKITVKMLSGKEKTFTS